MANISTTTDLVINRLSQAKYNQLCAAGQLNEYQLYITDDDKVEELSGQIFSLSNQLSDCLTSIPTEYKTYSQTIAVLSNDGYATSAQVNQKSKVSFSRITTSGTNIGSITIDGTTTQIYAPTSGGGGSSVQVSADYQTGTRIATISVDNVPTSIYVPNSSGGSSRYALETAQLVADNGSLTCAVNDQAITTIQVSSSTTPVVVQLPAEPTDGARDFILRIEISSSAAPTFTFNGVNETIDFDSENDDWAVMEPGLNLVSFTETKRGGSDMNQGGSTPTYCTVTFDIENGENASQVNATFTNPSDATRQVEAGQPVGTLPTLNYNSSYYTFQGWCTATFYGVGTGGRPVTDQTVITNDTTFYAIFAYVGGGSND